MRFYWGKGEPNRMGFVAIDHDEWKEYHDKIRDSFTWEDCAKRLAFDTGLVLYEARWVDELKDTGLHPFDDYDQIRDLFRDDWTVHGKFRALAKLIKQAKNQT